MLSRRQIRLRSGKGDRWRAAAAEQRLNRKKAARKLRTAFRASTGEMQVELLRLSEVDGDGLAVVRPLLAVNLQIVRFRIVVEPDCDWKARNSVSRIVGTPQRRQRRIPAQIQRRQLIAVAPQLRQRRIPAQIQLR